MTDGQVSTITAAALLFCGQVVTMIQNVFLARQSSAIHDLADGNLSSIRKALDKANDRLQLQDLKVVDLEKLVIQLASNRGATGPAGPIGATGEQGEPGVRS